MAFGLSLDVLTCLNWDLTIAQTRISGPVMMRKCTRSLLDSATLLFPSCQKLSVPSQLQAHAQVQPQPHIQAQEQATATDTGQEQTQPYAQAQAPVQMGDRLTRLLRD